MVGVEPNTNKRKRESTSGSEPVKRPCGFCTRPISCTVRPNETVNEGTLRTHEKICPRNPDRVVFSVAGLRVGAVFGSMGGTSEFQAPEVLRQKTQGAQGDLTGAIHVFPDGSSHPVLGKETGEPIRIDIFFGRSVPRCCYDEDKSMMQFRLRPELYPKLYTDGVCDIAEIGTLQIEGAPRPWTTSELRMKPLNWNGTIEMFHIPCGGIIKMNIHSCAQGSGPCRNCTGSRPTEVLYDRSFQSYLDVMKLAWTTVPDARSILENHNPDVQFTCTICTTTWTRKPNSQVQQNLGCPGCRPRFQAELITHELFTYVFPSATMYDRGKAVLDGVHANPFDVTSFDIPIIVETMSFYWHITLGRLPNDTAKMLAALHAARVYIMVHSEDRNSVPDFFFAWQRCVVFALRAAAADRTPRVIHVRFSAAYNAYDPMRDAAVAAGFGYEDIFCGDKHAHATVRLPDDTTQQTTMGDFFAGAPQ